MFARDDMGSFDEAVLLENDIWSYSTLLSRFLSLFVFVFILLRSCCFYYVLMFVCSLLAKMRHAILNDNG